MNFLEPWGLAGLAALAPVIALYFLKLKREERVVPSTLLWKKVIDDMQVNAPFQRLKYSLLLLLQLLMVALLAFALARPYLSLAGYAGKKIVLLIDTSASMSTRDGPGGISRLDAAMKDAKAKINDMRQNDDLCLVAFDKDVRQLCKFTSDRTMLQQLVSQLETRDIGTNADEAFETALALIEGKSNAEVLVLSDGAFGEVKLFKDLEAVQGNLEDQAAKNADAMDQQTIARRLQNFRFVSYGDDNSDNVGISQMDVKTRSVRTTAESGERIETLETQVFVMVENFSPDPKEVLLSIATEEQKFSPKIITLKPRTQRAVTLEESTSENTNDAARSVEVWKLPLGTTGVITAHIDSPKDKFVLDDTAQAVVVNTEGLKVLVVSKGNIFIEKALGSIRGLTLKQMPPEEFTKLWEQKGQACVDEFDACVFEQSAPLKWTDGGALFLDAMPPVTGFVKDEKPMDWPAVVDWDASHATMRYVNFGNVTVKEAQKWTVPKTTKKIVESHGGPLVVAYENDRMRVAGISFDVLKSDWAYRPSLPLYLRNVVPWLAQASPRRRPTAQQTGEPLAIPVGLGTKTVRLIKPDSTIEKVDLAEDKTTFVKGTEKAGKYLVKDIPGEDAGRVYAFNLANRQESDNAALKVVKAGEVSLQANRSAVEAKREIWRDLIIAAAAILLLEWWVFHRRVGL